MNRLRLITFYFPVWLLFSASVSAELTVIADLGGRDAAPFFEGINRQAPASAPVVYHRLFCREKPRCCRSAHLKCHPAR